MLVYSIALFIYHKAISIAALFNPKAKKWITGRQRLFEDLAEAIATKATGKSVYWFHCASLGEFEQGRPLIELFRQEHPDSFILLTFYSPSGYEKTQNYPYADYISYLPADGKARAAKFLAIVQPKAICFIKYEFWFYFLRQIHTQKIPCYLIAAHFRPDQWFFKWYGAGFRKYLGYFKTIFVQASADKTLLAQYGINQVLVTGDTRVDRTLTITQTPFQDNIIDRFVGNSPLPILIAGSVWDMDITNLAAANLPLEKWRIMIAPHEITETTIRKIENAWPDKTMRYSQCADMAPLDKPILILDNIGMLNKVYRYGKIAYIGGGFGKGIHNTLEPTAYQIPVIFGTKYQKFVEATELLKSGGAKSYRSVAKLKQIWTFYEDTNNYQQAQEAIRLYYQANRGAAQATYDSISSEIKA